MTNRSNENVFNSYALIRTRGQAVGKMGTSSWRLTYMEFDDPLARIREPMRIGANKHETIIQCFPKVPGCLIK
jgi:hypothetical protein